jgi:two-component system, NtrC family, response regulator AtoC
MTPLPMELPLLPDEDLARGSAARLLITASTPSHVEIVARRLHTTSERMALPFVQAPAVDFPLERSALTGVCGQLLDAAAGGTMLISNIEQMARRVQDVVIDLFAELERERAPLRPVRLISGTTVSLVHRVAAGTFSERLFYHLNTIHLSPQDER